MENETEKDMKKHRQFIGIIATILVLPSIFSARKMVQNAYTDSMFSQYMNEAKYILNQDQILNSSLDKDQKIISILVYGDAVDSARTDDLNNSLSRYGLDDYYINLIQLEASGRILSSQDVEGIVSDQLLTTSNDLQSEIDALQKKIDELEQAKEKNTDAADEINASIKSLYPKVTAFEGGYLTDGSGSQSYLAKLTVTEALTDEEKTQMTAWMKNLLNTDSVEIQDTVQ